MRDSFLNGRVKVKIGDITLEDTNAIVNAANSALLGGGGVDGAIHRAGGPAILEECRKLRAMRYPDGLPTGQAVITNGGMLAARWVIHTVGPIYGQNNGADAELLAECYRNCLELAAEHQLRSISFPSISTGVYSFPKPEAASVASLAIRTFLESDPTIDEVRLVFYSVRDADLFTSQQGFE